MADRAYVRISLDTLASGSIEKQRSQIGEVSSSPVWYEDRSVSGSKIPFAQRPEGKRLLDDLQPGDRVLFTKIDRAARNVKDLLELVETIKDRGATVKFVTQNIDTSGPMGQFILVLLGAVAELEANIISERRKESLAAFKEEGRHAVGSAPFGLQSVQNPNGRGLVLRPHPEEAPKMREAVKRVLAGESQAKIAESIGVNQTQLSRLLRNEKLAGILPSDNGVKRDPEMAVISLEEWDTLQLLLDGRLQRTWSRVEDYGAALFCEVCGDRMYQNKSKRNPEYATYTCARYRHSRGQGAPSVIVKNADAYIERAFLAVAGKEPVIEAVMATDSEERYEKIALARLELNAARRALEDAVSDQEEADAYKGFRAAKAALRAAEDAPMAYSVELKETGETYGDVWERASKVERADMLVNSGGWIVKMGRLPIEEKIVQKEEELILFRRQ